MMFIASDMVILRLDGKSEESGSDAEEEIKVRRGSRHGWKLRLDGKNEESGSDAGNGMKQERCIGQCSEGQQNDEA
jgi:hypothetical protein